MKCKRKTNKSRDSVYERDAEEDEAKKTATCDS